MNKNEDKFEGESDKCSNKHTGVIQNKKEKDV